MADDSTARASNIEIDTHTEPTRQAPGTVLPRPFLKWAGGKRQLLAKLKARMPWKFNRYFEPFVGGGALFFSHAQRFLSEQNVSGAKLPAYIGDITPELIECYTVVRDDVEGLITELQRHRHDEQYFYEVRAIDRTDEYAKLSPIQRASRLIFLNRTGFNGLYRVNSKGYFNVPFGSYENPDIVNAENLRASSILLRRTEIACASYLEVEHLAQKGDFVYFDPPYAPLVNKPGFTAYSKEGFTDVHQTALRDLCRALDKKGIQFMLSNSSAPIVAAFYAEFNLQEVNAVRNINSKSTKRGEIKEVIVTNY